MYFAFFCFPANEGAEKKRGGILIFLMFVERLYRFCKAWLLWGKGGGGVGVGGRRRRKKFVVFVLDILFEFLLLIF